LIMGDGSYGFPRIDSYSTDYNKSRVIVGSNVAIAVDVRIITGGIHRNPFEPRDTYGKGDVVIGDYVWIATGATILPGVHIGKRAVIGACSVVTRDVPENGYVAGNPARDIDGSSMYFIRTKGGGVK